jgi:hypothetical protein
VWRKAAVVKPVVIEQGRIVAIWSHKVRAKRVDVSVEALSGWHDGLRAPVEAEAQRIAAWFGRDEAAVSLP